MSINSHILGKDNKHVDSIEKDGYRGLYVVSNDLKKFKNRSVFFTNPTYGSSMNNDFSVVEATEYIHNGNDNTYWTATVVEGQPSSFNFSSTNQSHTGTQSIQCTKSTAGNSFQLEDETELHSSGDYDRFVGWIYVDGNWTNRETAVYINLYNTNLDLQVSSNEINLDNYINGSEVGDWQRFNIPVSDFGTLSNDYNAMRFIIGSTGTNPDFYLDDMELNDLGESTNNFSIHPPLGYWWNVDGFGMIIVSSYNSILADSSIPNIPYNGLLGTPLLNGIQYQRQEDGETEFAFTMNHLVEILNQYDAYISSSGYDGNYTWIKIDMNFKQPFLLKSEYEDFISFTLSDDLSALQYFRVVASIQEEKREIGKDVYDTGE